ncbi:FecCD family ABC transporter permease [Heyndrickxia ginsengihumi]|uniref:Iron ABC transporter permease n=1 Tax=Heyndrickxia ginsengihumi TaxID=363870 RepID=A0A6M0P8J1_9BACI|nr:iron ABC transporter permease [Heyndrickxia ginsengihumi]MBE6184629.1 iron ABC transporter permease [Bacillus sp. (in: firmicutes)]MCM3024249.1 iron ABC transporter permease [Heyndrickxia ginsengihumi]NEY20605.1 iron ABC transporter permease [Heyndrickxia ginsengihumi]
MNKQLSNRYFAAMCLTFILVVLLAYISLTSGVYKMTFTQVIDTFFRIHPSKDLDLIIFHLRLPRIVLAGLIGLGLAIAGGVLQGISRNPLADTGVLGINNGAGMAIVIFMFFVQGQVTNFNWKMIMLMPFFGLIGGLCSAFIIFFLVWERGNLDTQKLLLTGIAIGTGLGACSMYISLKMKASDFEMATVWLAGSIYSANWSYVISMIPWFLICLPILIIKSNKLDLFRLSQDSLISLGVATEKEKAVLLFSSVGLVSACVSVAGSIGFIGLISPHIAKIIIGNKYKRILPLSGMIGMALVIGSDLIAKTIVAPAELPVGMIISIVGVPYFIYILIKK